MDSWSQLDSAVQVANCMTLLYKRCLTTTSGGNVSVKDTNGIVWMTPSGVDKENVLPTQICQIFPDETRVGEYKPTSEWQMHFSIYKQRESIGAIVHTHSPTILSFALSHSLPIVDLFQRIGEYLGGVTLVPYHVCGSNKLADACATVVHENPTSNCFILLNHGVLVVGRTAEEAFSRLELFEKAVRLYLHCQLPIADDSRCILLSRPYQLRSPSYQLEHQQEYQGLNRFSRRAYEHRLVVNDHIFSCKGIIDSTVICYTPEWICPTLTTLTQFRSARTTDVFLDKHIAIHAAIYTQCPSVNVIFDCIPPFVASTICQHQGIDVEIMPESLVVLGNVLHIRKSMFTPKLVASCVSKGYSILFVEQVGVIVCAASLIHAYDRLEVLEATCESVVYCERRNQIVEKLSSDEVNEVRTIFCGGLIPKSN